MQPKKHILSGAICIRLKGFETQLVCLFAQREREREIERERERERERKRE